MKYKRMVFAILAMALSATVLTGIQLSSRAPAFANGQTYRYYPAGAESNSVDSNTTQAQEVGMQYVFEVDGDITGIRFYKYAGNTGTHYGDIFDTSGTLLASGTFSGETSTGWQELVLSTPLHVVSGTPYLVAYYAPNGHYAQDSVTGTYMAEGAYQPSGPIDAVHWNRTYDCDPSCSANTFPTTQESWHDYYVEPEFVANPTNAAAIGYTGIANLNTDPAVFQSYDSGNVELGVQFSTDTSGQIAGIRFYHVLSASGSHYGELFDSNGTLLASAAFSNETTGWEEVKFSSPVAISAHTTYTAAVWLGGGGYTYTVHGFDSPINNGHITFPIGAGVYRYGGTGSFPTSSFNNDSYNVDIDFEPGAQAQLALTTRVAPALTLIVSAHSGSCNSVSQALSSVSSTSIALSPTTAANAVGAQDLEVSTNAPNGFSLDLSSGSVTNGSHTYSAVTGTNGSPSSFPSFGTEAIGYTTSESAMISGTPDRFTNPSAQWAALSSTPSPIEQAVGPDDRTKCVAFQAGRNTTTPAGKYVGTVVYTLIPSF